MLLQRREARAPCGGRGGKVAYAIGGSVAKRQGAQVGYDKGYHPAMSTAVAAASAASRGSKGPKAGTPTGLADAERCTSLSTLE